MATERYHKFEFTFKWRHNGEIDKMAKHYTQALSKPEAMNEFRESEYKTKILMIATPMR